MLTAIPRGGTVPRPAIHVHREDGPFKCPECGSEVVLKVCCSKVSHFAHKHTVPCTYGAGETLEHMTAKLAYFEAFCKSKLCHNQGLEVKVGSRRPDVITSIGTYQIAIEIQKSQITPELMEQRTTELRDCDFIAIWITLRPEWLKWLYPERSLALEGRCFFGARLKSVEQTSLDLFGRVCLWSGVGSNTWILKSWTHCHPYHPPGPPGEWWYDGDPCPPAPWQPGMTALADNGWSYGGPLELELLKARNQCSWRLD